MSAAENKAVFLSYASQDADAARKICDALRAAGVEVWFDQSELRGGDAWDQKIRRQIKECALFLPVISTNTQARLEGYFRLEWRIAVERMQHMDDDVPFLLPVVVDNLPDAGARVPERFRERQWTRLPGGETPPAFGVRVQRLLEGEIDFVGGALRPDTTGQSGRKAPPTEKRRGPSKWWWALPMFGVMMALFLVLKEGHKDPVANSSKSSPIAAPVSEAQKLVAQARKIYEDGDELNRENLYLAEELVQRALKLDSAEPTAWEFAAWLSYLMVWHLIDESPERRETLLRQASRAVALAPDSVAAQLVYANAQMAGRLMVRDFGQSHLEETEQSLLRLAEREPQNWKIQRALGTTFRMMNRTDEAIRTLERAVELSDGHPMAIADLVNLLIRRQRLPQAEALLASALSKQRSGRLLTFDVVVKCRWRGDTVGALKAIQTWPTWLLQEDRGLAVAWQAAFWRRQPEAALRVVQRFPREEVRDINFAGPRAALSARAHELAGDTAAAQADWRVVEQRCTQALAVNSQDIVALHWKAWALARLGDQAGAQAAATLMRQHMQSVASSFFNVNTVAPLWVTVGWTDEALSELRTLMETPVDGYSLTRAYLELEPAFDPLRQDPRFQALLAQAPAPKKTEDGGRKTEDSLPIDQKSVAVLAFANLSDDKNNEYFSDGISEELLNVLAKVPGLKVTARTSSFHFKGKDTPIPEIAQQLGVAYVVEGSVRKSGDKVRITAQLIKASDGFHVWSDTFTRDMKDIFAVQDEIAGLIAQNLRAKMAISRERSVVTPEAYALVLQARHAAARQTIEGGREAVKIYREVLALAPDEVDAWAELAYAYQYLARFGGMDTSEGMREARLAARKALELDPEQPLGLAAFGWVQRTDDHDWRGAVQSFRHALAVAPENAAIMSDAAICFLNVGLADEALVLANRAAERDPLNPKAHWSLGIVMAFAGKMVQAEAPYRRAVELAPAADEYHSHLARVLTVLNRLDEAKAVALAEPSERYRISTLAGICYRAGDKAAAESLMAELIAKYGGSMAGYIAAIYAQAGYRDEAFKWLERGYETRDAAIAWVKTSDYLRSLHDDPRWPVFLHKMGLADDQLK